MAHSTGLGLGLGRAGSLFVGVGGVAYTERRAAVGEKKGKERGECSSDAVFQGQVRGFAVAAARTYVKYCRYMCS